MNQPRMPLTLAAQDIDFSYRHRPILRQATLSLSSGELVCLLGVNGAGKSTLLRILLGLAKADAGMVTLNRSSLKRWGRRSWAQHVAYVPQVHVAPFPYSVTQVALMGRLPNQGLMKAPGKTDIAYVQHVLAQLGISHLADRPYTEISGGERQLTLIARALAQEAQLLIMDEPLGGLDYGNQTRLLAQLEKLVNTGYGILMTTHDPNQALTTSRRVAILADGRICADGKPQEVLTPAAIHDLYGIRVTLLHTQEGQGIAFRPVPAHQI